VVWATISIHIPTDSPNRLQKLTTDTVVTPPIVQLYSTYLLQNAAPWLNILGLGVHRHDAEPTFTLYSSGSIQSSVVLQGKSLKEILSF
jgi:hypothetical protein